MFIQKRALDDDKTSSVGKIIGLSAAGLILLVYIGFSVFFMSHYYFQTVINEIPCAGKSVNAVHKEVIDRADSFVLTIHGREGLQDMITSADVSLTPEFGGEFKDVLKSQNGFLWPVSLFRKSVYEVDTVVDYSEENLEQKIDQLSFFEAAHVKAPKDAYLGEPTATGYEIVPENPGTTLIREKVYVAVEEAVDSLTSDLNLDETGCYQEASITSDNVELVTLCDNLNKYAKTEITYVFGEDTEVVNGEIIKDWLKVDGTNVTMDEEAVREYVNSISRKYDTWGSKREFQTTSGNMITISEGAYGWWIDRPGETKALIEAIKAGEGGLRSPVYRAMAAQYGEPDYGDSYVEIDLTRQHLWVYKDGQVVVESDFVSGNVNKGNGTPTGIYGITYKERDATLKGENYSSDVSFWMPFNGNVGMHDASWRSEFGGEIYLTNGSHGCINLPVKKAEEIYEIIEKNEAVIVYGGAAPKPAAPELTPEQQMALLIQAGILNPDGTLAGDGMTQ